METLSKSFEDLDIAADELLKKSTNKDNLNPEDISDDSDDEDSDKSIKKCSPDGDNIKKSKSTSDDDEDSDDNSDNDEDSDDDSDDIKKSLESFQSDTYIDFNKDEDISKGIESSEFQAALVTSIVKALGEIQYDFYNKAKTENIINDVIAKSLRAVISSNTNLKAENDKLTRRITKLEKSLEKGFSNILDAIDSISTQPSYTRKSVGSINVFDKDFNKSINGNKANDISSLSKGEVLNILNNELYSGNSLVQPSDIISYESGAPLRPELYKLVVSKSQ